MNDYRPEGVKALHEMLGLHQDHIDAWNSGYEFHDTHFPDAGPHTPLRDAMEFSPYELSDVSQGGHLFWNGFEQATMDRLARQPRDQWQKASADDKAFALEMLIRNLLGGK